MYLEDNKPGDSDLGTHSSHLSNDDRQLVAGGIKAENPGSGTGGAGSVNIPENHSTHASELRKSESEEGTCGGPDDGEVKQTNMPVEHVQKHGGCSSHGDEQVQTSATVTGRAVEQDGHELQHLSARMENVANQLPSRPVHFTDHPNQSPMTVPLTPSRQPAYSDKGDKMQIYWLRTLTCIFGPLSMAVYYLFIYIYWLQSYAIDAAVVHGRRGGVWAYYSWFVVAVFGINLSNYGLGGVEAAMLMDRRWKANNANQLIIHCDKTWGSPVGWFNIAIKHVRGYRQRPTRAWLLLASISLLPFLALPLSGFTMQLTAGYEDGNPGTDRALLTGNNASTFGNQVKEDALVRALNRWKYVSPSQLSGRSAFYVPETESKQRNSTWLQTFPNVWPDDDNIDVFLAPQSDKPVNGEAWGLQVFIQCNTVSSIGQFKLLSQRTEDHSQPRCPAIQVGHQYNHPQYADIPDMCDYDAYVQSPSYPYWIINPDADFVDGFMELAMDYERRLEPVPPHNVMTYTPFNEPVPVLIEAALWQAPIKLRHPCPEVEFQISNQLGTPVTGMNKTYTKHWDRFQGPIDEIVTLNPVGVQCNSTFRGGTATLNGLKGTYASFTAKNPVPVNSATLVPFSTALPKIVRSELGGALALDEIVTYEAVGRAIKYHPLYDARMPEEMDLIPEISSNTSWLLNIYRSVNAFNSVPIPCDKEGNPLDPSTRGYDGQQLQLITSGQFKRSIINAHKAYAIELMKTPDVHWYGNLTYAKTTTVLTPGQISPVPVLVLLIAWALCTSTLGVLFGLQQRWTDALDGFSMFRFGSDNPGFADGVCVKSYDHCPKLLEIPGLVGDSKSDEDVGHITLVQSPSAEKSKRYRGSKQSGLREVQVS